MHLFICFLLYDEFNKNVDEFDLKEGSVLRRVFVV